MVVIYAEKASLAKAIAVAMNLPLTVNKRCCVMVSGIYAVWLTEQHTEKNTRIGI